MILVQDAKDKNCTLGTRKSSVYHSLFNFAPLLCFPSSTWPSPNFRSLRHIAHHIPLLPFYPGIQAMADAKGKGKEVEREEAVVGGKLNSILFLALGRVSVGIKLLPCGKLVTILLQSSFLLWDFSPALLEDRSLFVVNTLL